MMTLLTGLVLAIFAGTMVQYGDSIISLLSGQTTESTEDDHFTALAGAEQQLDVLANDAVRGPLAITSVPACGELRPGAGQMLFYRSDATCEGEQVFTYCVASAEGCTDKQVTISVVGGTAVATATPQAATPAQTTTTTAADAPATATFATQTANTAPSDATGSSNGSAGAPQVMVDPGAAMASANEAAPEVDMVIAGVRPPMLAAPQVDELVAPNDAAAQLRAEMVRRSATADLAPASSPAAETTVEATIGQMDTSFTAPSLGDEGVSLGRSVVVAGTSFGGSAGGPEVEGSADVAIAGFQQTSTFATAPVSALSAASPASDAVEVLAVGPNVQEEVQVVAALEIPSAIGASAFAGIGDPRFTGAQVLLASATMSPSDAGGAAADVAIELLDAFPSLAAVQISDVGIAIDTTNDASLTTASAPLVNPASEPSAIVPPVADTSTTSPMALVATASTLLPSLESGDNAPARPRLLMRHVAMNSAPGALDSTAGDLTAGPSIDSSTPPPLQNASLTPEVIAPTDTLPGDTSCDISLDTLVRPGAEIELIIGAACRPNQMFTVSHAAIAFSEMTGADGTAIVQFPALERTAEIAVEFADGSSAATSLIVPDTETILRAGISWRGLATIELNAYEFGAPSDSPGHISPESPRDYRAARILGGGFLTELGGLDVADAAHASVYSMPLSRATPEGIITLSLRMGDAGAECGGSTELTTFRSENAAAFARQQSVQLAACGAVMPTAELMGLVDDLWTAAR